MSAFLRLFAATALLLGSVGVAASPALEEAIRSCDVRAATASLDGRRSTSFDRGRVALIQGNTGAAVDLLSDAVEEAPRSSIARLWYSRALFARAAEVSTIRKPFIARSAIRELEQSLALDPRNDDATIDLLLIHLRVPILGDGMDAARELARSLTRRDAPAAALANGMIAYESDALDVAERHFLRAASTMDDPRRALFWLGYVYQRLGRWDDAFDTHDRLLELSPHDPRAWYEIARSAEFSRSRLALGRRMMERYLTATLPSGSPSREDAKKLLDRLK